MIEKRGYYLGATHFFMAWLVGPIAMIVDALVNLIVTPTGYNSVIYDRYLELQWSYRMRMERANKEDR